MRRPGRPARQRCRSRETDVGQPRNLGEGWCARAPDAMVARPGPPRGLGPPTSARMKSLRKLLLEMLVRQRPARALVYSANQLGVQSVTLGLPEDSPMYSPHGGEWVEIPIDGVIAPYVLLNKQWQPEELEFIRSSMTDPARRYFLIDVGANVGLVTRQILQNVPQVTGALCFEPHPVNFRLLVNNVAHLKQCSVVNLALGSRAGSLDFHLDLDNAGNCSLNPDAMRGRRFRTISVQVATASQDEILRRIPSDVPHDALIWKSDTQGFDESIVTMLPDSFWRRVEIGVMEVWRIEKPKIDYGRFEAILGSFRSRFFSSDPGRNLSPREIVQYSQGNDYTHEDLFLAK